MRFGVVLDSKHEVDFVASGLVKLEEKVFFEEVSCETDFGLVDFGVVLKGDVHDSEPREAGDYEGAEFHCGELGIEGRGG